MTVDPAVDKALTYEIYLELIAVSLQPVAGVHAFLAEARAAGLRLAVATGSDRPKLNGNLAAIGVAESTFDVVISAEHVTHKKPDPETFLRAVEATGAAGRALPRRRGCAQRRPGRPRGGLRGARDHVVPARRGAPRGGGLRRRARLHGGAGGGAGGPGVGPSPGLTPA